MLGAIIRASGVWLFTPFKGNFYGVIGIHITKCVTLWLLRTIHLYVRIISFVRLDCMCKLTCGRYGIVPPGEIVHRYRCGNLVACCTARRRYRRCIAVKLQLPRNTTVVPFRLPTSQPEKPYYPFYHPFVPECVLWRYFLIHGRFSPVAPRMNYLAAAIAPVGNTEPQLYCTV